MSYVPTYIHNQKHKRFVVLFSLIFSKDDIPFLSSGFLTSILSSLILPHVYCFFLLVPYSSSTLLISFLILIFTSCLLIRNILLHHYLCLTASQPPFPVVSAPSSSVVSSLSSPSSWSSPLPPPWPPPPPSPVVRVNAGTPGMLRESPQETPLVIGQRAVRVCH